LGAFHSCPSPLDAVVPEEHFVVEASVVILAVLYPPVQSLVWWVERTPGGLPPGCGDEVKRGRLYAARRGGWGCAARARDTWGTAGRRSRSQPPPWVAVAGAWLATARVIRLGGLSSSTSCSLCGVGVPAPPVCRMTRCPVCGVGPPLPFVEVWRRGFLLRCLRREVALGGCVVPLPN
jgi:hypothetical protein